MQDLRAESKARFGGSARRKDEVRLFANDTSLNTLNLFKYTFFTGSEEVLVCGFLVRRKA